MAERDMYVVEYRRKNRSKYLLMYHIIFVVKYRKRLLEQYGEEVRRDMEGISGASGFRIREMEADRDHIHLMVESAPNLSPAQIVRRLKAGSTRMLWKRHPELRREFWRRKTFWSDGYFCATIGNASIETVQKYIEEQG
jgi:putative transposase